MSRTLQEQTPFAQESVGGAVGVGVGFGLVGAGVGVGSVGAGVGLGLVGAGVGVPGVGAGVGFGVGPPPPPHPARKVAKQGTRTRTAVRRIEAMKTMCSKTYLRK